MIFSLQSVRVETELISMFWPWLNRCYSRETYSKCWCINQLQRGYFVIDPFCWSNGDNFHSKRSYHSYRLHFDVVLFGMKGIKSPFSSMSVVIASTKRSFECYTIDMNNSDSCEQHEQPGHCHSSSIRTLYRNRMRIDDTATNPL